MSRLRASDLAIPSREIRVPRGQTQTLLERVRPYTELCPESCVSHLTAAQLHGMPLPWFDDEIRTIHLTRPAGSRQIRRRHVTGHSKQLPDTDIMMIEDVPVTTPARTFLDLATLLNLNQLVAVADALICEHQRHFEPPKRPVISAPDLTNYVAGKHGLPGIAKVMEAIDLMRVGVDSPPETDLRLLLHRNGLPEFTTNYAIKGDPDVYPDLACEEFKTSAQYEGDIHQTPAKQLFDRTRDERSAARGWLQVKVYKSDMRRGDAFVVEMFKKALRQRGWKG